MSTCKIYIGDDLEGQVSNEPAKIYGVIAEFKTQAPILMECEGSHSSHDAAHQHMQKLLSQTNVLRACVVVITYGGAGNELLLHDMKRMQE